MDIDTFKEDFSDLKRKESLFFNSFDFLLFLTTGEVKNLFKNKELYNSAISLINDLFQNIFSSLFKDDNFDELITIFSKIMKSTLLECDIFHLLFFILSKLI